MIYDFRSWCGLNEMIECDFETGDKKFTAGFVEYLRRFFIELDDLDFLVIIYNGDWAFGSQSDLKIKSSILIDMESNRDDVVLGSQLIKDITSSMNEYVEDSGFTLHVEEGQSHHWNYESGSWRVMSASEFIEHHPIGLTRLTFIIH